MTLHCQFCTGAMTVVVVVDRMIVERSYFVPTVDGHVTVAETPDGFWPDPDRIDDLDEATSIRCPSCGSTLHHVELFDTEHLFEAYLEDSEAGERHRMLRKLE